MRGRGPSRDQDTCRETERLALTLTPLPCVCSPARFKADGLSVSRKKKNDDEDSLDDEDDEVGGQTGERRRDCEVGVERWSGARAEGRGAHLG